MKIISKVSPKLSLQRNSSIYEESKQKQLIASRKRELEKWQKIQNQNSKLVSRIEAKQSVYSSLKQDEKSYE